MKPLILILMCAFLLGGCANYDINFEERIIEPDRIRPFRTLESKYDGGLLCFGGPHFGGCSADDAQGLVGFSREKQVSEVGIPPFTHDCTTRSSCVWRAEVGFNVRQRFWGWRDWKIVSAYLYWDGSNDTHPVDFTKSCFSKLMIRKIEFDDFMALSEYGTIGSSEKPILEPWSTNGDVRGQNLADVTRFVKTEDNYPKSIVFNLLGPDESHNYSNQHRCLYSLKDIHLKVIAVTSRKK